MTRRVYDGSGKGCSCERLFQESGLYLTGQIAPAYFTRNLRAMPNPAPESVQSKGLPPFCQFALHFARQYDS